MFAYLLLPFLSLGVGFQVGCVMDTSTFPISTLLLPWCKVSGWLCHGYKCFPYIYPSSPLVRGFRLAVSWIQVLSLSLPFISLGEGFQVGCVMDTSAFPISTLLLPCCKVSGWLYNGFECFLCTLYQCVCLPASPLSLPWRRV